MTTYILKITYYNGDVEEVNVGVYPPTYTLYSNGNLRKDGTTYRSIHDDRHFQCYRCNVRSIETIEKRDL